MGEKTEFDSVKARARKKLVRDMGPELMTALYDPKTVEIMCNADGKVWHERQGSRIRYLCDLRQAQAQAIIETIAGYLDKSITKGSPLLEGEFPLDGSRFAGQLPPVVPAPTFAIRKKATAIYTLDDYVSGGIMTDSQRHTIIGAVGDHLNVLVIGGTGSGKTTLVNAIINAMVVLDPCERVCIIEDTGEIQCAAKNHVQYHTSIGVSMTMLLKTTLRMRPDRILVGEVRGAEALDLLDAWNTGHPGGVATLHANSAQEGLTRLTSLVSRNTFAPSRIEPLISEAVDMVIHIARVPEPEGRRIQEILSVSGYADGRYSTQIL